MGLLQWFNRRNKFEKCLVCCILGLTLVIIILFICFLTSHDNRVCLKPECIRGSIHILDSIDPIVDPCEDFYAFACGQMNQTDKPTDHASTLKSLRTLSSYRLNKIVGETNISEGVPKSLAFQRTFYKACMDTKKIDEDENRTFLKILDELMEGWPLLKIGKWKGEHFVWQNIMLKARKLGLYHNLFFRVDTFENSTNGKMMLWVRPIDVAHLASTHFTDSNLDKILEILKDLGADSVDVIHDLRATITFAEKLTDIVLNRTNETILGSSSERTNITIQNIKKHYIRIDWVNYLQHITGIPIKGSDQIVSDIDEYFNELYFLLQATEKRIQANYVGWIILSTNINFLSTKLRKKYDQILKSSNVTLPVETRSDRCFQLSLGLFKWTAEAEYVRRYTTLEKKTRVQVMVDYIKSEMEELIETSEWMDEISRENGLKRLYNITTPIGWLDIAFNVTKLEKLLGFDKVKRWPDFNQTAMDIARIGLKIQFDVNYRTVLNKMTDMDSIGIPGNEVNAYFVRNYNILILPTAILQGQMFDENQPYYMNFGALGSVIGHELSHGFSLYQNSDDFSTNYDNSALWTNATADKRKEIVQCVDDQYNKFQVKHGKSKTNHTSGEENIADINGSNLAYAAYQNWISYNGDEPSLPGIKYTPNQLFWIMSSTYMCIEPNNGRSINQNHGMAEFRVIERLRQSADFAKDFNCRVGSKMNPAKKCKIYN
ncbi:neprilysin-2-like [Diorhabda carinulata]|uniref:neprilysin-2-like n=1 Tax=Diorhabda carinulata TaxID=1163345 RepID=UPI0025A14C37|nr:neprilysin-2-like [Diorhabda carinulata]